MRLNDCNVVEAFGVWKSEWISMASRFIRVFAGKFLESDVISSVSEISWEKLFEVARSDSPPLRLQLEVEDYLGRVGAEVSVRFHPSMGTGSSVTVEIAWPKTASVSEFHRFLKCAERAAAVARTAERILNNSLKEVNDERS